MKTLFLTACFLLMLCSNGFSYPEADQDKKVKIDSVANDSIKYELIVMDLGYETFLLTQPSMNFYSEDYYRFWNQRYVTEWNIRYHSSTSPNLYETYIDYDPNTNYGIELEYKLYYYFQFFEQTNHVKLIQRKG